MLSSQQNVLGYSKEEQTHGQTSYHQKPDPTWTVVSKHVRVARFHAQALVRASQPREN